MGDPGPSEPGLPGGIVWGLPVKPDDLLTALRAYDFALPAIRALRVCHRIGNSPLSRLSTELCLRIEEYLFISCRAYEPAFRYEFSNESSYGNFHLPYTCFQGQCTPSCHPPFMDDGHLDWTDHLWNTKMKLCEECEEEEITTSYECCERCQKKFDRILCHEIVRRYPRCQRQHESESSLWPKLWDDLFTGKYSGYGEECWLDRPQHSPAYGNPLQVLRNVFGLEVLASTVNRRNKKNRTWEMHENLEWHEATKQRATICFLSLPDVLDTAQKIKYFNQALDFEDAFGTADAMHNSFADISKRFGHLLASLRLRPFIHGSQRRVFPSGPQSTKAVKSAEKGETSTVSSDDWPRLVKFTPKVV